MTNTEFNEVFRDRSKKFAVNIIKFIEKIPNNPATRIMTYQLGKSGTSVGANFRAFCRGRSQNERFAKLCIVVEEADESLFWPEVIDETGYGEKKELTYLKQESLEVLKISASIKDNSYPGKTK